ncbi:MAG TPA: D-alanyl-D-alanine carboxypeptidase/D-alanyl-D-alanine-endopeptidase [Kofleriaceae bacterium]|nr:D-alanyl-D-alanine carboxypeptidase/D-alanyl-D-alanine-endopeptidase [Kofleriaceae bacterium]
MWAVAIALALSAPGAAGAAGQKGGAARLRGAPRARAKAKANAATRRASRLRPTPAFHYKPGGAAPNGRSPTAPWSRNSGLVADRAVQEVESRGLTGDDAVDAAVDHLMAVAQQRGIKVSLSVGSLRGARRTIAGRYAFVPFNPASNTKIVTAAHALDQLGPDFRFQTPFRTDAGGNLYVEGRFDPTFDLAALRGAARAIRKAGITSLEGDLVVDTALLDGDSTPAGREGFGEERWEYLAPPAPLAVDKGRYRLAVRATRPGDAAEVVRRNGTHTIVNEVKTVATGKSRVGVRTEVVNGETVLQVYGQIRAGDKPRDLVMVSPDPMSDVADRLRYALREEGVTWTGGVREGKAPRGATLRHTYSSPRLDEILQTTLGSSNSFDAEMLALAAASKARGWAPVSVATGAADLSGFLNKRVRLRTFDREYVLANASGLGEINQLTSDHVLAVLRYVAAHEKTRPLLAALATPGGRGTLSGRMRGTAAEGRVRAKTGTTTTGAALSGVVEGRGGADGLAFAALVSGKSRADNAAWLDALAITLSRLEPKAPRPAPADPSSWPTVPTGRLELETTFGKPGEHVVRTHLPLGPGGRMATVRLNKKLIPLMAAALADAQSKGLLEHIKRLGGTYKLRAQRRPDGTELVPRRFSTHSYGISFDINPDVHGGDVDPALGEHFEKYGFVWGKYFKNNYDPMHFQFVKGF